MGRPKHRSGFSENLPHVLLPHSVPGPRAGVQFFSDNALVYPNFPQEAGPLLKAGDRDGEGEDGPFTPILYFQKHTLYCTKTHSLSESDMFVD